MRLVALTLASLCLVTAHGWAQRDTPFDPDCELPFETTAKEQSIDDYCGPEGSAGSREGRAQNRAKNNFCAPGPPVLLRFSDFKALHEAARDAGIPYKNVNGGGLPHDRSELVDMASTDGNTLGEGDRVSFVGYIDDARYANVRRGESVNCKLRDWQNNDIHIELAERRRPRNCDRISAEVSPHYRPSAWTAAALGEVKDRGLPVRITGALFFDASHNACMDGGTYRGSTWEIHPVYRIEVCKQTSLSRCRRSNQSQWTDLHEWEPFSAPYPHAD